MNKKYIIEKKHIKPLGIPNGQSGCIATDRITVDGACINYMYKDIPKDGVPDSGWRFFSNDESPEYIADTNHSGVYALNTIANYAEDIIPLLGAPYGSAFIRNMDTNQWEAEARLNENAEFSAEIEKRINKSYKRLGKKQDILRKKYALGTYKDFLFEQQTGRITFASDDRKIAFDTVFMGSYAMGKTNFLWGWANQSLLEDVREQCYDALYELKEKTGIPYFALNQFVCNEKMVHELMAVVVEETGALGMYIAPGQKSKSFLLLTNVVS